MLVKYKKLNVFSFGHHRLIPGVNDIPQAEWEAALKLYPRLKHFVDAGDIETMDKSGNVRDDDAKQPGAPLEAADLSKLNDKKAIALVKETVDERLLNIWYESEKRKPVVMAIEGQFEAIAKSGEPEAKS